MRPILEGLAPPMAMDRDHWRGGPRAVVTLVEHGDYEGPYSRMAFRTIQRLEAELDKRLRFVVRHLPVTRIHPHAPAAAHLAEAAALQDRFWPMHELLFHRQKALGGPGPAGLRRAARPGPATADGRPGRQEVWQRVQAGSDSALEIDVPGTPTLFINARRHRDGYDEAVLRAALHRAIKET
jgi:Na+:H+ antiporter, NhaA family